MIVTLCSGSASGSSAATTAWPASWYAQVTRSCSLIATDLRSTPISTLSRAASRSRLPTVVRPARAAISAASLTRFARSAPEKPGRAARDRAQVDVGLERDLARVHAQNLLAALEVGVADGHLPVEAAGPQQRRIEDVRAVGGGDDDDALGLREAVHLDEQLVERLLALLVAERVAAAVAADGVELVDEDDARLVAARFVEQLAHARRADAGVHLDEVGAAGGDERHARLARHRSRQQRLAGARRADEQDAARNAAADRCEAAGSFRKSTISATSSFASSTPATSLNVTVTCSGSIVRALSSVGTRPVTMRKSARPATPKNSRPSAIAP